MYNGKPFVHLEARLQAALALYRAGQVKAILVSGNDTAASPEVTAMRTWLREHGVPERDIIADAGGSRTRDTMNRAAGLYDVRDAIVCTQDVAAARSVYLATPGGHRRGGVGVPSHLGESTRYLRGGAEDHGRDVRVAAAARVHRLSHLSGRAKPQSHRSSPVSYRLNC